MSKWRILERFLLISLLIAAASRGMAETPAEFPADAPFTESAPLGW